MINNKSVTKPVCWMLHCFPFPY